MGGATVNAGTPVTRRRPTRPGAALRRVGALLAVCAAGLLAPGASAQALQPQQVRQSAPQPVQNYVGCLNGQKKGDLLLLIDESSSLGDRLAGRKGSDPDAARVTAANSLLSGLAPQLDHAKIALDVQVAGFATEFDRNPSPWTPLSAATLPGLTDTVSGFRTRDTGGDTDYWMALEGARRSLADHAKAAGAEGDDRCQAIAWFSDGTLDIEPRHTAQRQREFGTTVPYSPGTDLSTQEGASQAWKDARTSLCRPGGQADGLRQQHIVMFSIGLTSPGTSGQDFDLMRSISTGVPVQGGPCGAIIDPPPGTFQLASDLGSLLFAFNEIIGGGPPVINPICAPTDTSCRGREFVLDESIDGFRIVGQADLVPGLTAELIGPDGAVHKLDVQDPAKKTDPGLGPVTGTYTWQDNRTVVIDIANPSHQAGGWTGVWALRFVDPKATTSSGAAKTSLVIWGDVYPAWVDAKKNLPAGAPVPDIGFQLVKADGTVIPAASLKGTFRLSAVLVDPAGKPFPVVSNLDRDSIGNAATLDLTSISPGKATLRLTLDVTTAPAPRPGTGGMVDGTPLSTQINPIDLTVDPPQGSPHLPARIDFPHAADGATQLDAIMPVSGPGCVWVGADAAKAATLPDGVSAVTITADGATGPQGCLSLADGQSGALTLHLNADHPGNGVASGDLTVSYAPRDHLDQVHTQNVEFSGDLRIALNPFNFWATLIAALLLGAGIPVGLLYLVKWATAKIPAAGGLYAELHPGDRRGGAGPARRRAVRVPRGRLPRPGRHPERRYPSARGRRRRAADPDRVVAVRGGSCVRRAQESDDRLPDLGRLGRAGERVDQPAAAGRAPQLGRAPRDDRSARRRARPRPAGGRHVGQPARRVRRRDRRAAGRRVRPAAGGRRRGRPGHAPRGRRPAGDPRVLRSRLRVGGEHRDLRTVERRRIRELARARRRLRPRPAVRGTTISTAHRSTVHLSTVTRSTAPRPTVNMGSPGRHPAHRRRR